MSSSDGDLAQTDARQDSIPSMRSRLLRLVHQAIRSRIALQTSPLSISTLSGRDSSRRRPSRRPHSTVTRSRSSDASGSMHSRRPRTRL